MRVSLSILLKYDAAVFKFILNTFQSRCGGGSVVSDENVSSSHESSVRKISISTYFLTHIHLQQRIRRSLHAARTVVV